ncbi:MAG TPA: DUF6493 family protein [Yinghuangia sp.]|nr:DUF6493 family protein [Yinghuangia sp.]
MTDTSTGELTWAKVLDVHRQRGSIAMVSLLAEHTEEERRALVPDIRAHLKERDEDWLRWEQVTADRALLKVSGAACLGGPGAIAQWLSRAGLRTGREPWVRDRVVQALAIRPATWLPDIARRLADRLSDTADQDEWALVDQLFREQKLPPPTNAHYVRGWFDGHTFDRSAAHLVQLLHADPYTPAMLPLLFEVDEIGRRIDNNDRWRDDRPEAQWAHAVASLVRSDGIDRATVVDACLSRLLRGVPAADARGFVRVYQALAVTDDEVAARTVTFLRLLPDAPSTVAQIAQAALRRLDDAGRLSADQVVEATRSVLFRPEKKLVRAQFTWLDKAVPRHRGQAGELLAAATSVFTQSAADLHDRALKCLARHLPKLTDDQTVSVRAELRASLDMLGGPARMEAAALLGEEPAAVSVEAPGPPPFVPRELPDEIGSLDELAEEFAATITGRSSGDWWSQAAPTDPWSVERLVTAVLRESARDREALAAALGPTADRFDPVVHQYRASRGDAPTEVRSAMCHILRAACGQGGGQGWFRGLFGKGAPAPKFPSTLSGPQRALMTRLHEIAQRLRTPRPGPHLARPATAAGCVDPARFVRELEEYEASGRTPWAADFEQALLRLPRDLDPDVVARAGRLSSPAGTTAWEVMVSGGVLDPKVTPGHGRRPLGLWERRDPSVDAEHYRVADIGSVPEPFASGLLAPCLFDVDNVGRAFDSGFFHEWHLDIRCWPMVMPGHRDVVAAHMISALMCAPAGSQGGCEALPYLAEADGPAGDGLATALAYGLVARTAEDRMAATDAFVTMASRDDAWDAGAVGVAVADLTRLGHAKANRLHDSLRQAVDTGAHAAVWQVMTGLLPELFTGDAKVTRLGDLVGLAAECASRAGARGALEGLERYATPKGSSRVAVEARRLHTVLSGA